MLEIDDVVRIDMALANNALVYHRYRKQTAIVLQVDNSPGWGELRYSYMLRFEDGSIHWVNGQDLIKLVEIEA